jgi:hypothetical protein
MITDRSPSRVTMAALFFGVIALTMILFRAIAHADTGAQAAPPGVDVPWLVIVLAAIGGLESVLRGGRIVLGVIAPRTKNTLDDRARDTLARMDDAALALLAAARGGLLPKDPPTAPAALPQARITAGSKIAMLAVLVMGISQMSCAAVSKIPAAAKTAVIECGKADAPALVAVVAELGAQALLSVLKLGHIAWPELEATALAHGKKDGYCAALAFVRAWQAKQPAVQGALAVADQGEIMLEQLRQQWPGVEWHEAVAR